MIYIDQETGKRVNPYAPYKGFSRLETPEQFLKAGVISIEDDPIPEDAIKNPDFYTIQEDWETSQRPYTVYTRKSDEQVAEVVRSKAKAKRQAYVDAIKVTTKAGNEYDGDEVSQGRMARAIIALQATGTPTVKWVLANNVPTDVPVADLVEALALASGAQAAIWSSPYEAA